MTEPDRPLILLSNDDGVDARGNRLLRSALESVGEVYTVAPEREQSAKSHSITLHHPLRFRRLEDRVFAVDGTPADCVYVAFFLKEFLPRKPDMVVSGINHGHNLGSDVHYSGTVAAAREGALRGVPSLAFSSGGGELKAEAQQAAELCRRMAEISGPEDHAALLNINFPPKKANGVRVTRLGLRIYSEGVQLRHDPRGKDYLWIGGPGGADHQSLEGSDTEAIDAGYTSVTPLNLHSTQPNHFGVAAYVAGPGAED